MTLLTDYIDFFKSFPLPDKLKSIKEELKILYGDFKNAKKNMKSFFEKVQETVSEINLISEIPGSELLNYKKFVSEDIKKEILENATYRVNYTFILCKRRISVNFICLDPIRPDLLEIKKDMCNIYMWLYVASLYANEKCGKEQLTIFIYKSKMKRELPTSRLDILGGLHINGGMSDVCTSKSEIAIYRQEEWFKVLIHETFHNLGLDFSAMNINNQAQRLKRFYRIKTDMLFFESYTEVWAEIVNVAIISFKKTNNFNDFEGKFNELMYYERVFSLFQCVKVLNFMGLSLNDVVGDCQTSLLKKQTLYKENTNVFCYYILKNFLIQHYDIFVLWCKDNNIELLSFKNTEKTVDEFVELIKQLTIVKKEYLLMEKIYREKFNNSELFKTMRMTVCEID